ncbi:MAG: secondary thiamine-phosphate synthase enzyme YjbQ [Pseudomonadota bacterium]
MIHTITIRTRSQGIYEFTDAVNQFIGEAGVSSGLCTVLVQHTSASLTIQENADPSARRDLMNWLERMVPENDPHYTHTAEGPDDMPAHIKSMLTQTSLSIPIERDRLALGTSQGLFLLEHRYAPHSRTIKIHVYRDQS